MRIAPAYINTPLHFTSLVSQDHFLLPRLSILLLPGLSVRLYLLVEPLFCRRTPLYNRTLLADVAVRPSHHRGACGYTTGTR